MSKDEASDLKSLINGLVLAELELERATLRTKQAQRLLESALHSLQQEKK